MIPSTTTSHGDSPFRPPFRLLEGRIPSDIDAHLEFGGCYHVSARIIDKKAGQCQLLISRESETVVDPVNSRS